MITFEPGETIVHALDPRSKLVVQIGFAIAVISRSELLLLAGGTVFAGIVLVLARLSPIRVLRTYWFILIVLAIAPFFATLTFGPPWVVAERAIPSVIAGYQVVLVLFVSAAYVRTTPVRETRAAVQRHVPGTLGQMLGVGIGLVFRLFPVLLQDLERTRLAIQARAGSELSATTRIRLLTTGGLRHALHRADTLSLALKARCFSWNPTLPALRFRALDYPVTVFGLALVLVPFL
jgi:biotin transport system permease protein